MALVETPENWAAARLGTAVWSDPAPALAVQAAIYERAVAARRTDIAGTIFRNGYVWAASHSLDSHLRDVPASRMAATFARAIRLLAGEYVDMDVNYAARDWASFPVPLATRMARGEHPMGIGPGLEGGEAEVVIDPYVHERQETGNLDVWRAFLADCRWWLDRMTIVAVPAGDYGWTKRGQTTGAGTIAEKLAHLSLEDIDPGGGSSAGELFVRASKRSEPDYVSGEPDTTEGESSGAEVYFDLHVRNRSPFRALLRVVSKGGYDGQPGRSSEYVLRHGFCSNVEQDIVHPPIVNPDDPGIARFETLFETESSTTTTIWSDDYSQSYSKTEATSVDTSGTDEAHHRAYSGLPWPELHGLRLGLNVSFPSIPPGGCVTILPYGGRISVPSAPGTWTPEPLHGYNDRVEYNTGSISWTAIVFPVLDFSQSFRFKP